MGYNFTSSGRAQMEGTLSTCNIQKSFLKLLIFKAAYWQSLFSISKLWLNFFSTAFLFPILCVCVCMRKITQYYLF